MVGFGDNHETSLAEGKVAVEHGILQALAPAGHGWWRGTEAGFLEQRSNQLVSRLEPLQMREMLVAHQGVLCQKRFMTVQHRISDGDHQTGVAQVPDLVNGNAAAG